MRKPTLLLLPFSAAPLFTMAQSGPPSGDAAGTNLNVVILVLATIFAGIILFLVYLERRLTMLEKRSKL